MLQKFEVSDRTFSAALNDVFLDPCVLLHSVAVKQRWKEYKNIVLK